MAVALWAAQEVMSDWFLAALPTQIAGLALLVGGGIVLYGALAVLVRAVDIEEILASFKRGKGGGGGRP
jgi:hypothetical protein